MATTNNNQGDEPLTTTLERQVQTLDYFASHFIGGHRYRKFTACLMNIKQREDKTLRSYITRLNKEAISINEADDKILMVAFTNGLRKGKFLFSLYKNHVGHTLQCYVHERGRHAVGPRREAKEEAWQDRGRQQGLEIGGRIDSLNPPLEGSQTSPR